ncbi:two-component regulator propeller domain-containing protein [Pedobacter gandavensis]|uniref:hybrid sensor histidine kinase/response regulator transcription factor n=1 Tax=Pedobacter gandavensis TaxID=2679963 RepID=UPI00292F3398|nr:two-component regulator propeller domain-containing protein [Pedobacter gandavensis]
MYEFLKSANCRIVLMLLLWLCTFSANGQKLNFEHLTVKDGLSHNSVLDITQDNFGFMWFATGYGLNRYDGSRFNLYKKKSADTTSISDNYINTLYVDRQQKLWVGTAVGLNTYEPRTDHFKRIQLISKKEARQPDVSCIYEDKKANLWIGTKNGLFVRRSGTSDFLRANQLGLEPGLANAEVLCVYEDQQGYLWIGTGKGLIKSRFNQVFSKVETYVHNAALPGSISDSPVKSILEDRDGNIWMATESRGLNLLNRENSSFVHYEQQNGNLNTLIHNSIRKMIPDGNGNFLIGTQGGLSVFNPLKRNFSAYQNQVDEPGSLNQNSIYSLYKDKSDDIWIGTYFGGINLSYGTKTPFKTIRHKENNSGINDNVVRSIVHDKKGDLWIGTEGGGLNHFNQQTKKFSYYVNNPKDPESLTSNFAKTVYIDKSDHIWVGTSGGGLNLFDPATGKFKHFLSGNSVFESKRLAVLTMLEDTQGRFWIGGLGINGLYQRKGTQLIPVKSNPLLEKVKDKLIQMFIEDKKGNIWALTRTEIYCLSKNNKQITNLSIQHKNDSSIWFNCLTEDYKGNIWIGLYHGGVYCYSPEKKRVIRKYNTKDGLCNDNVLGILEDEFQDLWLSTANGLSRLNPEKHTFQNYTVSDGLADNEFNFAAVYKSQNDELYFGSMNGLTYFSPAEIKRNNHQSAMVFTGLKLGNEEVVPDEYQELLSANIVFKPQLIFSNAQNIFTLEFALLNFIKSDKNKYAYKLEGINKEWNETVLPEVTYANLPAGNYVFSVKGANNDGLWSKVENIRIRILPPFYKSWWAYLIYSILIAVVVFLIVRFFYLQQLLKREEELHQLKLNFFTNISHEIRSHLSLIMIPLERVIDESKPYDFIHKQLNGIKNNADRLLGLVTELMDFRKAESQTLKLQLKENDLVRFLSSIYDSFKEICKKKQLDFSFVHPEGPILVQFDKDQLEKVIFNLLSNAYKFTPEGGKITLELSLQKDEVLITVSDTGKGISPIYFDKLFSNYFQVDDAQQNTGYGIGLALSKHIIELHQGKIELSSKVGFTQFKVSLPLQGALALKEGTELEPQSDKAFTILIVEDNEELRALIKDLLEPEYHVLESTDGLQALQLAKIEIPDLIITDVMMPNMNGFELCQEIKSDEQTSHIPVILLTAKDSQSDQISGLSKGADVYLSKPFSIKILLLNVRNILQSREVISSKYRQQFIFSPSNILLDTMDEQFLSRLIAIIEEGMENKEFGVDLLSNKMAMSQSVLYKKVKALTDMTVNDFSKSIRLKKAAQLLKESGYNVSEISSLVGFLDARYFSKEFKKQFGRTPRDYLNS